MELEDLIMLAAAPMYIKYLNNPELSQSQARAYAVKQAKLLWEEVYRQNHEG